MKIDLERLAVEWSPVRRRVVQHLGDEGFETYYVRRARWARAEGTEGEEELRAIQDLVGREVRVEDIDELEVQ